jgi:hypothetical protein
MAFQDKFMRYEHVLALHSVPALTLVMELDMNLLLQVMHGLLLHKHEHLRRLRICLLITKPSQQQRKRWDSTSTVWL